MMRFISGTPGAGKTLFAVSEILKQVKEGREVYTNIAGINIQGVTYFDESTDDTDWRNYPDGSLIVYDEAHQLFRATGKAGLSNNPVINDMDMHRHRGFDLWFLSQFPTKVHHEIRHMCDEHYHLLRQFGAKQATLYKWPECTDVKDQRNREQADSSIFFYPKECFKLYKSSVEHTDKIRIPAKLKFAGVVLFILLSFVFYRLSSAGGFESFANSQPTPATGQPQAPAGGGFLPSLSPTPVYVALGGCVSSDRGCQCYTPDLTPIPMEDHECRNVSSQPLPTNLKIK